MASVFAESFGIFIVDVDGRGFVRFSSIIVGLVFLIGAEFGRDLVVGVLILVDLIGRDSFDDEGLGVVVRSFCWLIVDVWHWLVFGLKGPVDEVEVLFTVELADLTDSLVDCFCCWLVLLIGDGFDDEINGFFVIELAGGFDSVLIGVDLLSKPFFFSSFVDDGGFAFLTDGIFDALVDWFLLFEIGIVMVNFDCLLSSVDDDEIGLVVVEIFFTSVLAVVEDEQADWAGVFFDIVGGKIEGFFGVALADVDEAEIFVLFFL